MYTLLSPSLKAIKFLERFVSRRGARDHRVLVSGAVRFRFASSSLVVVQAITEALR